MIGQGPKQNSLTAYRDGDSLPEDANPGYAHHGFSSQGRFGVLDMERRRGLNNLRAEGSGILIQPYSNTGR